MFVFNVKSLTKKDRLEIYGSIPIVIQERNNDLTKVKRDRSGTSFGFGRGGMLYREITCTALHLRKTNKFFNNSGYSGNAYLLTGE